MKLISKKTHLKTIPFNVEEIEFSIDEKPMGHSYFRLSCADWVNVLPITSDGHAVLIRQPRVGTMNYVYETPGGMVELEERDPTMAVVRELEEETGFTSQRILPLGSMNPNPAIMTNRCHYFLALNCFINPNRQHFPDEEERIELHLVPVAELEHMVRTGQVNHSLSALCIMLAGKYLSKSISRGDSTLEPK